MKFEMTIKIHAIPQSWFPRIEKALDIKISDEQRRALFNAEPLNGPRRSGNTTVHCIQIALSIGPPIKSMSRASDYGDGSMMYKSYIFPKIYMEIAISLIKYGFDTRKVGILGGWKLRF